MKRKIILFFLLMTLAVLSVQAQSNYQVNESTVHKKETTKTKLLKVYPVPATTQITFQIVHHGSSESYEIIIYNFLGKMMDKLSGFTGNKSINLENYNSGIYIYQMRTSKGGELVDSGKFNVIKQ